MSTYTVVKGDTLSAIATKFGTTVADLKNLNGLKDNILKIGQVLKLKKTPAPAPPKPVPAQPAPPAGASIYKVVKGDTLSGIAKRFGTTVEAIKTLSKLKTTVLSIGQVLQIPGTVKPAQPQPPTTPPVVTPPVVTPPPPVTPPPAAPGDYMAARKQYGLVVRPDTDFRRFELSVPLPDGRTVVAKMRDNVKYSTFTKYPEGIVYGGQSTINIPIEKVVSVGLTSRQAAALEYVSSHEGKYDAINSYDGGIFSFGFIQFVGAVEHGGSLNRVLAGMKANAPARFAQVFQQVGIDSAAGNTTVLDESGRLLSGDEAWLYIQKTVPLYGAFIRAGFDPDLVLEQLRAANDLYVQSALNFRLNLTLNGVKITVPRLRDILSSEGLLTAVIAIAINRGTGTMGRFVGEIMTTIAAAKNITTPEALRELDERLICQTLADSSTDTRTRARAQGVLDAGLSFEKA